MTLKELCIKHNITQSQLSRRFNVPLRSVQAWHNEERRTPTYFVAMADEILTNAPMLERIKAMINENIDKE